MTSSAKTPETPKVVRFFSKEEILACDDLKYEDVEMPEWGGCVVRLRQMSGAEASAFVTSKANDADSATRVVAATAIDPTTGKVLFGDTPEEVALLSRKSFSAIFRLAQVAMRINGMEGELKQAVKND